jgi:hypothetical protein
VHDKNDHLASGLAEEHSVVDLALHQAEQLLQDFVKLLVPAVATLLESIERFLQAEDLPRVVRDTRGLSHVDDLIVFEDTVEVSTFDVNLVYFEVQACC